ncbi:type 1 glutamine amidotransferase [Pinibacter aurantiacus]|uniref:Type 1 glutamine amidotransferase n=1 Tax=Pinibacter aurantiacus TaxID=2851599 RepID=A0A9E2W3B6_9BACT|nr:type 1 glutamine amidotransferase [Pinibacter aurantiacus]MBV4356629.1 type 1 glutamine amidotransferase [Pinibacter aurantiacus]
MRIHYIQHVPFEEIGYIQEWLTENNIEVSTTKIWESATFPSLGDFDGLVVMGGPMGVYEEELYEWMAAEKTFIKYAIGAGKKVLGICLGSQLVASVLGANVYPNNGKEIGWFDVSVKPGLDIWLGKDIETVFTTFHWHGDTFDLPEGCINHINSPACENQFFTQGENVAAIQFHPEATSETVNAMVENCSNELVPDNFVQSAAEIQQKSNVKNFSGGHQFLSKVLNRLFLLK